MKPLPILAALLTVLGTGRACAEWCDPPITPMLTTPELAKEFREEFKGEFDQYFRAASEYAACLDTERARIFEEMQFTAQRYERFLNDSENWEISE